MKVFSQFFILPIILFFVGGIIFLQVPGRSNLQSLTLFGCGNMICDADETIDSCPSDCQTPYCGDNICNDSEDTISCPGDCHQSSYCGDGQCNDGETSFSCPQDCNPLHICGDGICDVDENASTCFNDCGIVPQCGNGSIEAGEECDTIDAVCVFKNGDGFTCQGCQCLPACGNGTMDIGEECDDGNGNENDVCHGQNGHPLCGKTNVCGDFYIYTGVEECDDGNQDNDDGCSSMCKDEKCGDGTIQAKKGETCDDGNEESEDGCSSTCKKEKCGDTIVQKKLGEQCDLGIFNDDFGPCTAQCKNNVCGDGARNVFAEDCDDGNKNNEDGCSSTCKVEKCGDAIVQNKLKEECDDGEFDNSDVKRCTSQCKLNVCGDGKKWLGVEQCDDGNQNNGDGCSSVCKEEKCGDSVVQKPKEECDDGNQTNIDDCVGECKNAKCGDGYLWKGKEYCDVGNNFGPVLFVPIDCNPQTCQKNVCGDGIMSKGEQCDDYNKTDGDGCSAQCKREYCGDKKVQAKLGEQCDDGNSRNGDGCEQCKKVGGACSDTNKQKCTCDDVYTKRKVDEVIDLMLQEKPDQIQLNKKIGELPKDCLESYLCKQETKQIAECAFATSKNITVAQVEILLYAKNLLQPYQLNAQYRDGKEILNYAVNNDATRSAIIAYAGTKKKLDDVQGLNGQKGCQMMSHFINKNLVYDYHPKSVQRIKTTQMSLYLKGRYFGEINGAYSSVLLESLRGHHGMSLDFYYGSYLPHIGSWEYIADGTAFGKGDRGDSGVGTPILDPIDNGKGWNTKESPGVALPLGVLTQRLCRDISYLAKTPLIEGKTPVYCATLSTQLDWWKGKSRNQLATCIEREHVLRKDTGDASGSCRNKLRNATVDVMTINAKGEEQTGNFKIMDIGPGESIWASHKKATIDITAPAWQQFGYKNVNTNIFSVYDVCWKLNP